ncbi:MAG TPA: response regulator transcription factor, partial [Candidatus Dormibacteraeota bacterium]
MRWIMRVLLAEDSLILRDGLVRLLADHGHVAVATVSDATNIVEAVETTQPDVAILDIRMPPTYTDEGLRGALALRLRHPEVGVLVFSQYVETNYASQLFSSGSAGIGYLLKDRVADVRDFIDAVVRVGNGGTALDPEVVRQLLGTSRRREVIDQSLTGRERDVLALMAEGRSNAAIADALVVGTGAVEKHVANIFGKLGLPVSEHDNRRV